MPILQIHLFRVYNSQHESDIIGLEAVETERRSRLVYCRLNILQTATKYSLFFYFLRQILNKIVYYMPDMFPYNDTENDWISRT